jgi:hypothetical protein
LRELALFDLLRSANCLVFFPGRLAGISLTRICIVEANPSHLPLLEKKFEEIKDRPGEPSKKVFDADTSQLL